MENKKKYLLKEYAPSEAYHFKPQDLIAFLRKKMVDEIRTEEGLTNYVEKNFNRILDKADCPVCC